MEKKIKENDNGSSEHRRKIENALDFAQSAYEKFQKTNSAEEKRFLIRNLGANLTLNDKKVRIKLKKYLQTSKNKDNWDEQFSGWCEPPEYKEMLGKNEGIRPPKSIWLEKWEDFRKIDWINYLEYPEYILKEINHFSAYLKSFQ